MRIYRVEHLGSGLGPYMAPLDAPESIMIDASISADHPSPIDDGVFTDWSDAYDWPQYRFGFASPRALMNWFGDVIDELIECGYVIAQYDIDAAHIKMGGRQVAFNHDVANLVSLDDNLRCLSM